jgi:hypothetical protein
MRLSIRLIDSTLIGVYEVKQHNVIIHPKTPNSTLSPIAHATWLSAGFEGGSGWCPFTVGSGVGALVGDVGAAVGRLSIAWATGAVDADEIALDGASGVIIWKGAPSLAPSPAPSPSSSPMPQ